MTCYSIAIETSCRNGGVALGRDDELSAARELGPTGRHATELLAQLDDLLKAFQLRPADLGEAYVSAGPGSFTGLRVGITAARTLGQLLPDLKLVSVPTPLAVAENVRSADWRNLGVLLAAKESIVHATLLERDGEEIRIAAPARLAQPQELLADWPRPLMLTGEALEFLDFPWPPDVRLVEPPLRLPTAEGVWRVGRRLAAARQFTPWNELLPIYARRPEAVRLWEQRKTRTGR
jgi:tRNA threonylcarbamoyladenosine biosynthesis protein TsaB